jgi:C_GCAxxG_C_C family probable redox protein
MKLKLTLEEAKQKARDYLMELHCGPTVLRVMWEAYGWKDEGLLWAGTAFRGGIGGRQQAPCGVVSGAAIVLGLRHRVAGADKTATEKARQAAADEAAALLSDFEKKFGALTCIGLLGVSFSNEAEVKKARESGVIKDKCPNQVAYAIEKLYELEAKRG